MLRFVILAGVFILSACGSEPEKALTACEEHDFERFRAPPIDTTLKSNPSEFDAAPSQASLRFYLQGWDRALKRVVRGGGSRQTVWEYSWSETENYCLFHLSFSTLKGPNSPSKPLSENAKSKFKADTIEIGENKNFFAAEREYETIPARYTSNGKIKYCTLFRSSWDTLARIPSENLISGWLCTSKNRPMPTDALPILLMHLTHMLSKSDAPLDVGTMPAPQ